MDSRGNDLLVVRGEIGGKGSIESGVMELAECLGSIKVCTTHHYRFTRVCQFYDSVPVAMETLEGQVFN